MNRIAVAALLLASVSTAIGCTRDEERVSIQGTLRADGYALFQVENERQQRDDVTATVRDVEPGTTYALMYADYEPRNVGWFAFDPATRERCGGDIGAHCELPGYGYLVDVVTVPAGANEATLRDVRCGCNADHADRDWAGHWAVMRVGPADDRTRPVTFDVRASRIKGWAEEPEVRQRQ